MCSAKELVSKLKCDGWNLDEEGVDNWLEGNNFSVKQATEELLNTDLKDVGATCLHEDLLRGKKNSLSGPLVLQVAKMRNVAAPKAFEESGGAPRMLRVTLTDGLAMVQGLEVQNIKALSLKTAPGTKIRLNGKVPVNGGFLLLNPNNITVIGGTVQELYEKWKLSVSVSKYSRTVRTADGTGPPPWVPFGKRIVKTFTEMEKFKALKDSEGKEKIDGEFENQRKQAVKELSKEGNLKVFGGGKQMLDANVQKVVNAGFSLEVAEWALRNTRNDTARAIKELRAAASGQPLPERSVQWEEDSNVSSRRGRGGRGRGRGKGRSGGRADDSDEDFEPPPNMPRPSGPASLFDFFDSKMIEKKEAVNFVEPVAVNTSHYNSRGSDRRGRGGESYRGRGYRGNYNNRGMSNGRMTPPNLTVENWPAPGEEKTSNNSNRSYLESKELMEEKERQDNLMLKPLLHTRNSGREYQRGSNQERELVRENEKQRGTGHYARDVNYTDGYGKGNFSQDRGAHRGSGGNYRGSGKVNNYRSTGDYGGENVNSNYYAEDYRGGRGRGDNAYQNDGSYGKFTEDRGSNYRGDYRSGNNRNSGGGGGANIHYSGQYEHYNPRQRGYGSNYGGARGNSNSTRGEKSDYSSKEMEMIQDFQRSMILSGHYQQDYGSKGTGGRYDGTSNYSSFVGTLEFHRGGRGGGRRGRGGYY